MSKQFDSIMQITPRPDTVFERGEGSWLFDSEGNEYLDCVQGWAVNTQKAISCQGMWITLFIILLRDTMVKSANCNTEEKRTKRRDVSTMTQVGSRSNNYTVVNLARHREQIRQSRHSSEIRSLYVKPLWHYLPISHELINVCMRENNRWSSNQY